MCTICTVYMYRTLILYMPYMINFSIFSTHTPDVQVHIAVVLRMHVLCSDFVLSGFAVPIPRNPACPSLWLYVTQSEP